MTSMNLPAFTAESLLTRLKANGIDYLFANGGTDFAPLIEGYASGMAKEAAMPQPVIVPHETAAIAMAHGYYLVTGKPQSVMVHVNVGLANCVMGIINANSENIPMLVMAGRTPLTEFDRTGSRMSPVQYAQEMRDQGAMVREIVKWDYELRYGEQVEVLVDRAFTIATSEPKGPVYLGLPREPLAEAMPQGWTPGLPRQVATTAPQPDRDAIREAARLLAKSAHPLIICQRGDPAGTMAAALGSLADKFGLPVVEFQPTRNVLASDHPMHCGYDPAPFVPEADVIVAIDSPVPWIQRNQRPGANAKVIHIGADPLFTKIPVRSFPIDLAITSDPTQALLALAEELARLAPSTAERHKAVEQRNKARRAEAKKAALAGNGSPMSPAWVSHCLSAAVDRNAVIFSELGTHLDSLTLHGPNRCFNAAYSGGLGWGLPAGLGAALADRERLAVSIVGDGSYMFANPVACHQIAEAHQLPLLTIVMNNGVWNAVRRAALAMYPKGRAAGMGVMPITSLEPTPDFAQVAAASRAWSASVENGADLPGALEKAISVIRKEKRQALLNLKVSYRG